MLELNLFYEQQELQHQRDYDPVKLTILGGIVIILGILLWGGIIYIKSASLRNELAENKKQFDKMDAEFKALGELTDLQKIQNQAQSLHNRIAHRALLATQLDIFRAAIPTNCQLRVFNTSRSIAISETATPSTRPGKPGITIRKAAPSMDLLFEVTTRAKSKSDVLQIRDSLEESLRHEPRFRNWIHQVPIQEGATNLWNEVIILSSNAQDPLGKDMAIGIFKFRMPMDLKDEAKELP